MGTTRNTVSCLFWAQDRRDIPAAIVCRTRTAGTYYRYGKKAVSFGYHLPTEWKVARRSKRFDNRPLLERMHEHAAKFENRDNL